MVLVYKYVAPMGLISCGDNFFYRYAVRMGQGIAEKP